MSVDPKVLALFRAVARNRSGGGDCSIADLAAQVNDWDAVYKLAMEHRVLPLLNAQLSSFQASVPPDVLELFKTEGARNAFHCLANASELIAIVAAFEQVSIPILPFKGLSLAASIYGDLTARSAGDLDFLVFDGDLLRATRALQARGYHLKTPTKADGNPSIEHYYEYHFERWADGMVAELRWRLELTDSRFRRALGMEWLWPRRRQIPVAGAAVPDLDPVDKLLVLCMHGTKHRWSRLNWICDVAGLIEAQSFDWKIVAKEAGSRGLWRSLALGVLLASRVCRAQVPLSVLRKFESDRTVRDLSTAFADNMFEEPGKIPRGRLPYGLKVLDSIDRIRWVLTMQFLKPNQRDFAVVRLPKPLYPLYLLVRPLRVLFDRSAR